MKKTCKEWIMELPEPFRSEALKRMYITMTTFKTDSMYSAIELSIADEVTAHILIDKLIKGEFKPQPTAAPECAAPNLGCGVVRFLDSSNNAEKSKLLEQLEIESFRYTNSDQIEAGGEE